MTGHAPPLPDALRIDAAALDAFIAAAFTAIPAARRPRTLFANPGHVRMLLTPDAACLRPGNIVSGPTLMGLADHAAYALVLAHIGPVAMAVTSSLNFQFLRACPPEPVTADARLLRLGKRLAVIDVRIWTATEDRCVGQAVVTYAIPDGGNIVPSPAVDIP